MKDLKFTGSLDNDNASAAATLKAVSMTITAGGSGYSSAPTVAFTGGGGTGMAGTAVLTGDAVSSITITNAGTGYTTPPTVSFTGGAGTGAAATAVMGVGAVNISKRGNGYASAPTVSFSGGAGTGAAATAALDTIDHATDQVNTITVSAAGTGYTSVPTVTLSDTNQSSINITYRTDMTSDDNENFNILDIILGSDTAASKSIHMRFMPYKKTNYALSDLVAFAVDKNLTLAIMDTDGENITYLNEAA